MKNEALNNDPLYKGLEKTLKALQGERLPSNKFQSLQRRALSQVKALVNKKSKEVIEQLVKDNKIVIIKEDNKQLYFN